MQTRLGTTLALAAAVMFTQSTLSYGHGGGGSGGSGGGSGIGWTSALTNTGGGGWNPMFYNRMAPIPILG